MKSIMKMLAAKKMEKKFNVSLKISKRMKSIVFSFQLI